MVGVGVIVLRDASVLLVRRNRDPGRGTWAIPGGAQRLGETVEQAGRRELREETGLEVGPLRLAGYVDAIHPDAAGHPRFHYTILDLAAAWHSGEPVAGDDAAQAAFMPLDDLLALGVTSDTLRLVGLARELIGPGPGSPPPSLSAGKAGLCPDPPKARGLWKPLLRKDSQGEP